MNSKGGESCDCDVCRYAHEVDEHLKAIVNSESREFFERMYEKLCGAEMDNDVNRAMLNGDWPSGKLVFVLHCKQAREQEAK